MKKFLAFFLALVMVLGLCACGGNGDEDKGGLTADGKVKLTVGIKPNALIMDMDNNALTKWVEETCGVEIEFQQYAGGTDVASQIGGAIGARQELPDILYGIELEDNTLSKYGKEGYFLDLTEYYEDRDGASKTFWDRIESELDEETRDFVIRTITDADTGEIYCVPTIETSLVDRMNYQMWINMEWLDAVGLDKPTNNDELYEVLKAFKEKDTNGDGNTDDQIPLYGSKNASMSGDVIDWLINLFIYYNEARNYQVSADDKLSPTYTDDKYREALQFINKLYKEGLLSPLTWTDGDSSMKSVITPGTGVARCGIFAGHLTAHATPGSEVLYEYEPLQTWGNAVRSDVYLKSDTYITEYCEHPDKAFEVLMTLFSWDGSMRIRYGEKGANWTDADEGAKSDIGFDATYKLISDPLKIQSTAVWGTIASTLNVWAEGETAQIAENMDQWTATKSKMHAESNRLFEEAAANNNPEKVCPKLTLTTEEKEATKMERTNINSLYYRAQTEFCTGVRDPYSDADWQAYLDQMEELGLSKVVEQMQSVYDRT